MAGFSITDFTTMPSGFTLVGDAAANISNGIDASKVLRLTTAEVWKEGAATYDTKVCVNAFTCTVKFRLTNGGGAGAPGGSYGGDGFVVALHNDPPIVAGDTAGCFMMYNIAPSVIFEVDTWANLTLSDPDSSHVGITIGGCVASVETATISPRLNDGNLRTLLIEYANGHVDISLDGTMVLDRDIDIATEVGGVEAWLVAAGATGNAYQNHDIIEWLFEYEECQPVNALMFSCNT